MSFEVLSGTSFALLSMVNRDSGGVDKVVQNMSFEVLSGTSFALLSTVNRDPGGVGKVVQSMSPCGGALSAGRPAARKSIVFNITFN